MGSEMIQHSTAFRVRRFFNWFPLGLSYALLYMGRYNLTVSKNELGDLMSKEAFGLIFFFGALTYGVAFLLNGPLTDKIGGKKAILISMAGSSVMNLLMGLYLQHILLQPQAAKTDEITFWMSVMYALNMYFQSFGAVAIVKVNSTWFHVRERGGFSGIFGTMISSGIFLAFTVNSWILSFVGRTSAGIKPTWWVFFAPALLLGLMFVIEFFLLRDHPSEAGQKDFDTGDASSGEEGDVPLRQIILRVLTNPIILTVGLIEFCTGVLRNGVMHWFPIYAKEIWVLPADHFVRYGDWGNWYLTVLPFFAGAVGSFYLSWYLRRKAKRFGWATVTGGLLFLVPFLQGGWGGILMVAGVIGGNVAGWLSDLLFQSRRAPVAAILYGFLIFASVFMFFMMGGTTNEVGRIDKKSFTFLQKGDVIEKINGIPVARWEDISRAVACVPARCQEGSRWNPKACTCTARKLRSKASLPSSSPQPSLVSQPPLLPKPSLAPKQPSPSSQPSVSQKPTSLAASRSTPLASSSQTSGLHLAIVRQSQRLTIHIPDPQKAFRPGDQRSLPVAPKLLINPFWLCLIVFLMSLSVIGTHGLLSGTATMDFGGRKGAATAVGLIDGFVYLGTAVQSVALGYLTSANWAYWPFFLMPFGVIGFLLLLKIWHAIPSGKKKAAH